jgi:UDP-N-acetylglucosamine acyltransferase
MPVHPTAIVDAGAKVHPDADIGPFCVLGPEVEIGARTRLMSHLYVEGPTAIGEDNLFYPFTTVGVASQDLKYRGERAETRIGHRNRIRESVTIHRGTAGGGALTSIGDDNLLMAYVHVAHDVRIGSHTVLANAVTFAGHVTVADHAGIGAFTGVHQFCRIGRHCYIGGYSVITQDVMPFALTAGGGREVKIYGANRVGLERRGFSATAIETLQRFFRLLSRGGLNTTQALERAGDENLLSPEVEEVIAFIRASERGVVK